MDSNETLTALFAAREHLEQIDRLELPDEQAAHLVTTLEALDNLILAAGPDLVGDQHDLDRESEQ